MADTELELEGVDEVERAVEGEGADDGLDGDERAALAGGATLAEVHGLTAELGGAILDLAEAELRAGRLEQARTLLEGLVVSNPFDGHAWGLLSSTHRRLGQPLAARFCAEVAVKLVPEDPWARLARVESCLAMGQGEEARAELCALTDDTEVGGRARMLAGALSR
ncbi:MAG: hypothetical protein QM767_05650 [Anaeromyxobacter sp.]